MSEVPIVGWRAGLAHLAVPIDLSLYSIDAIMRAAYKFTDRCFVVVQQPSSTECTVFLLSRSSIMDAGPLGLEFHNELLDQQIRCRLEDQFKDMRTLIVAQAF